MKNNKIMKKFILVLGLSSHPDETYIEWFDSIEKMTEVINNLNNFCCKYNNNIFSIIFAGEIKNEIKYKLVEQTSEYKIQ